MGICGFVRDLGEGLFSCLSFIVTDACFYHLLSFILYIFLLSMALKGKERKNERGK